MSSRVGRMPISLPKGVEVSIVNSLVTVKGPKGQMVHNVPSVCDVVLEDGLVKVAVNKQSIKSNALMGTTRALLNNHVVGVSQGFTKKMVLVGVGYRVQLKGSTAVFTLGLSHPVEYKAPEGITFNAPSQTELEISGVDKQVVGQVAAEIRAFRKPEPYKGKGIRYSDEKINLKETKKK